MTPANLKRFKQLSEEFQSMVKENPNASATMYFILKVQNILTGIATDLHFRPEINSEK